MVNLIIWISPILQLKHKCATLLLFFFQIIHLLHFLSLPLSHTRIRLVSTHINKVQKLMTFYNSTLKVIKAARWFEICDWKINNFPLFHFLFIFWWTYYFKINKNFAPRIEYKALSNIIYRLPTSVPSHPITFRTMTATVINIVTWRDEAAYKLWWQLRLRS